MLPVVLATLSWLAFHYFTGLVRLAGIKSRPTSSQPGFIAFGKTSVWTPLWIHCLGFINTWATRNVIPFDWIIFLVLRAALVWWLAFKLWSWVL